MRTPIVFCLVALGAACGTSTTPGNGNGNSSGASSSSGASPASSGSSSGSSDSSSSGASTTSSTSGGSSSSGSGSSGSGSSGSTEMEAGGPAGDEGGGAGGSGGDASGGSMSEAGAVATGDGGACSGTLYSAGFVCGPNVAANTGCTILGGAASATPCGGMPGEEPKCMTCPPADGEMCCPAPAGQEPGSAVHQLLLGMKDSVTFTNVYAPADGDYDIVWYYHCGNADVNGYASPTCGTAAPQGSMTGNPGCREAAFTVNGVDDPKLYEIPCYLRISAADHGWNHIHSWVRTENVKSTVHVPFHLKAGSANTIKIYARNHDTVDLVAIRVPDGR